jgi:hypothetical protein
MLLYDICKALSEASDEATTAELVMVASAACAQQCINLTTTATTEPRASSSSTATAATTCTVSHDMLLQCLEWLTVCTATASTTATTTGAAATAAAAVLRAAITLLTVHACSSATVTSSTGSTQLSVHEQTALRTSLLHMYDRIPSSGMTSTVTAPAAVTELQNSTGVVIAGARMLVSVHLHITYW